LHELTKLTVSVVGTLKGYDQLMNLVVDDVKEVVRGELRHNLRLQICGSEDNNRVAFLDDEGNESTRQLGLVVARGPLLVMISPVDGSEEIPNPFAQEEE
jgi:U6 snRNA-associated Sm-like protein LSm7